MKLTTTDICGCRREKDSPTHTVFLAVKTFDRKYYIYILNPLSFEQLQQWTPLLQRGILQQIKTASHSGNKMEN